MVEPENAREALDEITARQDQSRAELAAALPPWWISVLLVAGYYTVLAGSDFAFPIPLITAAAGACVLVIAIAMGIRYAGKSQVQERRGLWSSRNITITGALIVGAYVAYAWTKQALESSVPEGITSVLAAVPATILFMVLLVWLMRQAFGTGAR
jgi:hypothetical protein